MKKYYVYGYFHNENDKPFYIGKGSGNRINCIGKSSSNRNKKFYEIIEKNDYYTKILYDNLTNEEALKIEKELINTLEDLTNINDRIIERRCTKCKRSDVEFYDNISNERRCKDCNREIQRNRKRENKKNVYLELLEEYKKKELAIKEVESHKDILDLYKLIYK